MSNTTYVLDHENVASITRAPPHQGAELQTAILAMQTFGGNQAASCQDAAIFVNKCGIIRHNRMGAVVSEQLYPGSVFEGKNLAMLLAEEKFEVTLRYDGYATPDAIQVTGPVGMRVITLFEFKMRVDFDCIHTSVAKYQKAIDIDAINRINKGRFVFKVTALNVHPITSRINSIGQMPRIEMTTEIAEALDDCDTYTCWLTHVNTSYKGYPSYLSSKGSPLESSRPMAGCVTNLLKSLDNTNGNMGLASLINMTKEHEIVIFWAGILGALDNRLAYTDDLQSEVIKIHKYMLSTKGDPSALSNSYFIALEHGDLQRYVNIAMNAELSELKGSIAALRQYAFYYYKAEIDDIAAGISKKDVQSSGFESPKGIDLWALFLEKAEATLKDECVRVHSGQAKPSYHCLIPICNIGPTSNFSKIRCIISKYDTNMRPTDNIISSEHPASDIRAILSSSASTGIRRQGLAPHMLTSFQYILTCISNESIPDNHVFKRLDKDEDLTMEHDIVTDGVNFFVGKVAARHGGQDGCTSYLTRAGVGKKNELSRNRDFEKVIIVSHPDAGDDGGCEYGFREVDTKSRVLDINCELCMQDALFQKQAFEKWASLKIPNKRIRMDRVNVEIMLTIDSKYVSHKTDLKADSDFFMTSRLTHSTDAMTTLFEGLYVQAGYKRDASVSVSVSSCPSTILIRLSSGDLSSMGNNVAYMTLQVIDKPDVTSDIVDLIVAQHALIDYLHVDDDYIIIMSKPMRLDRDRISTLTKGLVSTWGLYMTFLEGAKSCERKVPLYQAFSHCFNVSKSQLDIKDCLKYWIGLSFSDSCNFKGYISDKFNYRVKSLNEMQFLYDIIKMFQDCVNSRELFFRNTINVPIEETDSGNLEGGCGEIKVHSPFVDCLITQFKDIANPCYAVQMQVQRGLHNPSTNKLAMVNVPCKYEVAFRNSIGGDPTSDKMVFSKYTVGGNGPFSYSPNLVMGSCLNMLKNTETPMSFRSKMREEERFGVPMAQISTLTSNKSCTNVISSRLGAEAWVGSDDEKASINFMETLQLATNGTMNKRQSAKLERIIRTNIPFFHPSHREAVLIELMNMNYTKMVGKSLKPNIGDRLIGIKYKHYKSSLTDTDYISANTVPVSDSMYVQLHKKDKDCTLLNHLDDMVAISAIYGMFNKVRSPVVSIFEKHQRTSTDREIFITNLEHRTKLYFLEHVYSRINKSIEEEMISVKGELKTDKIYSQIKAHKKKIGNKRNLMFVNIDESKWSASDLQLKFVHAHAVQGGLEPSEKLQLILFQLENCLKLIVVDQDVLDRRRFEYVNSSDQESFESDPLFIRTNRFRRNFIVITQNWLQGNLNAISSHCNAASCIAIEDVLVSFLRAPIKMSSMVHSDDSSLIISVDDTSLSRMMSFGDYGSFLLYVTKRVQSKFCITMNDKKSYASAFLRDFISEIVINGGFIENYGRHVSALTAPVPCRNFKEDLLSLSAPLASMAKRGASTKLIYASYTLINYHIYHTYSMCPGETQDPRTVISDIASYPLDVGGLFQMPPSLLIAMGPRAHNSYMYHNLFKSLVKESNLAMSSTLRSNMVNVMEKLAETDFKLSELASTAGFLHRNAASRDGFNLSPFDNSNVVKVALFQAQPKSTVTRCPIKTQTFRDIIDMPSEGLNNLLMDCITDMPNWYAKSANNSAFIRDEILKYYEKTGQYDFQDLTSDRLRMEKMKSSNNKLYMACNLVEGISKTSLSESINMDAEMAEVKFQIDSIKRSRSLIKYRDYGVGMKMALDETELMELEARLNTIRLQRMKELCVSFPDISSYCRSLNLSRENPEKFVLAHENLQVRMNFVEGLRFLMHMRDMQTLSVGRKSFLLSYAATALNDVSSTNYCSAEDVSVVDSMQVNKANRFMELAKGPSRGILHYRAKDIVPMILLPSDAAHVHANNYDADLLTSDVAKLRTVLVDLDLTDEVSELVMMLDAFQDEAGVRTIESSRLLVMRNHSKVMYLLLCEILNQYQLTRVYICSRGPFKANPADAFLSMAGNFVHPIFYSVLKAPYDHKPYRELDQLDFNYSNKHMIRSLVQTAVCLVRNLYHVLDSSSISTDYVKVYLNHYQINSRGLYEILDSKVDEIHRYLSYLVSYLPLLFHLGLISPATASSQLDEIYAVWEIAHKRDGSGFFRVRYSTNRLQMTFAGDGAIVNSVEVFKNNSARSESIAADTTAIFSRLFRDIKIKFDGNVARREGFVIMSRGSQIKCAYQSLSCRTLPSSSRFLRCAIYPKSSSLADKVIADITQMNRPSLLVMQSVANDTRGDLAIECSVSIEEDYNEMSTYTTKVDGGTATMIKRCTNTYISMISGLTLQRSHQVYTVLSVNLLINLIIDRGSPFFPCESMTAERIESLMVGLDLYGVCMQQALTDGGMYPDFRRMEVMLQPKPEMAALVRSMCKVYKTRLPYQNLDRSGVYSIIALAKFTNNVTGSIYAISTRYYVAALWEVMCGPQIGYVLTEAISELNRIMLSFANKSFEAIYSRLHNCVGLRDIYISEAPQTSPIWIEEEETYPEWN